MSNHLIAMRMSYSDDELFQRRLEISKKTFIPSILNQINKNFTVACISNERHREIINRSFDGSNVKILFFNSSGEVNKYVIENNIKIQSRIDDDDIIVPEYIDIVQRICREKSKTLENFIIQTQPYKYLLNEESFYETSRRYGKEKPSMFLTLYQTTHKVNIFGETHDKMSRLFDECFSTDEGMCRLVIHENNKFSRILNNDKKINIPEVSIVIPTFNNVEYIDECLMSVIESSENFNFEILVGIDNCQKTLDYVKEYQDKYINTKFYFFDESVGPYVIKNTLTQVSKSNNILFFDSDDIMEPECVSFVMEESEKYGSIRFKYRDFREDEKLPLKGKSTAEGVFFIKKSYFNFLNGFEPWKCAADSEFHYRTIKNNIKTKYSDFALFLRRIHGVSLTRNSETGMKSNVRSVYHKIIKEKQKVLNIGPLDEMITHRFYEIEGDDLNLVSDISNFKFFIELDDFNHNENHIEDVNSSKKNLSSVLPQNFNPSKEINYKIINKRINQEVTTPKKQQVVIQNKPKDRNDLIKLKKDSLVKLNLEFGNVRNKKKNRNSGIF
jgi:glycosyltransferase involved in cell wall biosynthesis